MVQKIKRLIESSQQLNFFQVKKILKVKKTQYSTYCVSKQKPVFVTPAWLVTGTVKNVLQIIIFCRFISRFEFLPTFPFEGYTT